ncbi:MAG: zinc metalloprotease HtpX [Candidatus Aenigmarchaeota archaeon]|nr:zinc metalloprotease HtpX [Candidatus Aenigmarchaeota archaeon]
MSSLKAVFLLAILTAIFLGIGYFFGGILGMTIGLVIAFSMNFLMFWFSDKIVLAMYRAKKYDNRKIRAMVEKLSKKADIPVPELYIVDMDVPNAFATGRGPGHSVVAVTRSLADKLDDDEIEGVLAHEINHIKHRDTLVSTMAATIGGAITWIAYLFWFGSDENKNIVSYILLFVLAPIAALLVRLAISRNREYFADRGGAEISTPSGLASALRKISAAAKEKPVGGNHATSHMFIVNPFSGKALIRLFSTHPPIDERIRRLEEME